MEPSQTLLRENFTYDINDGWFYSKKDGKRKGTTDEINYRQLWIARGWSAYVHRCAWIFVYGFIPLGRQINHINHKKADNRLDNLELVTPSGNMRHYHGKNYESWK